MSEYLEEAREGLKRVDHIIYVSLKYTRTVDIIRNALNRMVSAFDYIIEGILDHNREKKKIPRIPPVQKDKIETLAELYKDDLELKAIFFRCVGLYNESYIYYNRLIEETTDSKKRRDILKKMNHLAYVLNDSTKIIEIEKLNLN